MALRFFIQIGMIKMNKIHEIVVYPEGYLQYHTSVIDNNAYVHRNIQIWRNNCAMPKTYVINSITRDFRILELLSELEYKRKYSTNINVRITYKSGHHLCTQITYTIL
jgi:hypothetical protein